MPSFVGHSGQNGINWKMLNGCLSDEGADFADIPPVYM